MAYDEQTIEQYGVPCAVCGVKHIPSPNYYGNKSKCEEHRGIPTGPSHMATRDWFLFGPNNARDSDWD